jgi:hypothetical protein
MQIKTRMIAGLTLMSLIVPSFALNSAMAKAPASRLLTRPEQAPSTPSKSVDPENELIEGKPRIRHFYIVDRTVEGTENDYVGLRDSKIESIEIRTDRAQRDLPGGPYITVFYHHDGQAEELGHSSTDNYWYSTGKLITDYTQLWGNLQYGRQAIAFAATGASVYLIYALSSRILQKKGVVTEFLGDQPIIASFARAAVTNLGIRRGGKVSGAVADVAEAGVGVFSVYILAQWAAAGYAAIDKELKKKGEEKLFSEKFMEMDFLRRTIGASGDYAEDDILPDSGAEDVTAAYEKLQALQAGANFDEIVAKGKEEQKKRLETPARRDGEIYRSAQGAKYAAKAYRNFFKKYLQSTVDKR